MALTKQTPCINGTVLELAAQAALNDVFVYTNNEYQWTARSEAWTGVILTKTERGFELIDNDGRSHGIVNLGEPYHNIDPTPSCNTCAKDYVFQNQVSCITAICCDQEAYVGNCTGKGWQVDWCEFPYLKKPTISAQYIGWDDDYKFYHFKFIIEAEYQEGIKIDGVRTERTTKYPTGFVDEYTHYESLEPNYVNFPNERMEVSFATSGEGEEHTWRAQTRNDTLASKWSEPATIIVPMRPQTMNTPTIQLDFNVDDEDILGVQALISVQPQEKYPIELVQYQVSSTINGDKHEQELHLPPPSDFPENDWYLIVANYTEGDKIQVLSRVRTLSLPSKSEWSEWASITN